MFLIDSWHLHLSGCPAQPSWCRSGSSPACSCWSCRMTWCVPKERREREETPFTFLCLLQRHEQSLPADHQVGPWEQLDWCTSFNLTLPQFTQAGQSTQTRGGDSIHLNLHEKIESLAILTASHSKHSLNIRDQGKPLIKRSNQTLSQLFMRGFHFIPALAYFREKYQRHKRSLHLCQYIFLSESKVVLS